MLATGWIVFIIIVCALAVTGLALGLYFGLRTSSSVTSTPTPTPTPTATEIPIPTETPMPTPTLTPLPRPPQGFLYVSCQDTIECFNMNSNTPVAATTVHLPGIVVNDQGFLGLSGDWKTLWIMTTTGLLPMDLTIDPPSVPVDVTVAIPNTLYGMAVYNNRAYVINNLGGNSDFITVDLDTSTIIHTLALPTNATPRSIAVSPFGDKAYVCTITTGITTIRPILNIKTTPTLGPDTATGSIQAGLNCVVSNDGNTLYVSDFATPDGGVYPVDVSASTPVIGARIATPDLSQGITISPSNTIAVVGGTGPAGLLTTIENNVPATPVDTTLLGSTLLAIYTATNVAYITNKTGSQNISAVDLITQLALATIGSGGTDPSGILFGPTPGTV